MTVYHQQDDAVQQIKDVAEISEIIGEHVKLQRAGTNFKGLCPFHNEKTPSFTVNPDRKTYHCFGCNEGGDVFNFMMNFHRMTFPEALKELARKYQIVLPENYSNKQDQERAQKRDALHAANQKAAEIFHNLLRTDPRAQRARDYLNERGIPPEIADEFLLGFAPDSWDFLEKSLRREKISSEAAKEAGLIVANERGGFYDRFRNRVMFPISGITGQIVGFGGRILGDGQPKYMNSPESLVFDKSRTLFGLYQNREHIRKSRQCIIVEGNFDLLSLVVHGVRNVVAPLGTALTQPHVRALKGYADEAVLLFDGDQAGLAAAMRAVPIFLSEQLTARIAVLPNNHDPDTFIREFGKQGLTSHLKQAQAMPEFVFDKLKEQYGLSVAGKAKIVEELRPIIKAIGDQHLQQTLFISHFSKKLELRSEQLLAGIIPAQQPPVAAAPEKNITANAMATLPLKQRQLLEFIIVYPEYLNDFLAAGIGDFVVNDFGINLLELLKESSQKAGGPEQILETATGRERSFISQILIATPSYPDEIKENMARDMLAWLKKNNLKIRKERLNQQIGEAHKAKNDQLCLELMTQKKLMDEEVPC
ncbi:MAG: DNA primase [Desulfobulbaceae bacterium]|nr:DNA primase [Desulfobulbaceae bacterium]HIJ79727.1 DNA primase [Deltaproteobacteria bacterium]